MTTTVWTTCITHSRDQLAPVCTICGSVFVPNAAHGGGWVDLVDRYLEGSRDIAAWAGGWDRTTLRLAWLYTRDRRERALDSNPRRGGEADGCAYVMRRIGEAMDRLV